MTTPLFQNERLFTYDKEGNIIKPQDRLSLLEEIKQHSLKYGDANLAVPVIHLMLTDSTGNLYIVQRGDKPEDSFRYDKTVGGHITAGDTADETLRRETQEEIGVEALITDMNNYHTTIRRTDTTKIAVVRQIGFEPWSLSVRQTPQGPWNKRDRATTYAGRYDGNLTFKDGEAVAVMRINIEELKRQLWKTPEKFTYDLPTLIEKYEFSFKQ